MEAIYEQVEPQNEILVYPLIIQRYAGPYYQQLTSDGNHEIFLKQESDSPSFDERNQTILIDGKKLEVIFTDVYIAQDKNIENIFFGCIGKDNKKWMNYRMVR